jgi:amino acid adenylation domain-containing protein
MNIEDIEDIYPLSPLQHGMLFHALYMPGAEAYFEQFHCRLDGLNESAFRYAWEQVVERHTILRTGFIWDDGGEPVQIVSRKVDLPWQVRDWRQMTAAEQREQFETFVLNDRLHRFVLTDAPLMRLALIRTADEDFYFVWSRHHLLMDGWSAALLLKEVFAFYDARCESRPLRLPAPRPYRDYIAWLDEQDDAKAELFWRARLKGFTSATALRLNIPAENLRQLTSYDERQVELSEAETALLLARARKHRLTLGTLVQGAWALLLSGYSGQEDIVFGVVVSGRQGGFPGIEAMAGLFINTLPIRLQVRGEMEEGAWLEQLQTHHLELQQYEYSRLAEVQSRSEAPGGQPLFDSILVVENFPVHGTLNTPRAGLQVSEAQSFGVTTYPLTVVALPERRLRLAINYDCTRFDDVSIERMLGHLRNLLKDLLAYPDRRLSQTSMLSESERRQLLVEWNETKRDYPDNQCLHHLFEDQVERTPEAIAAVFEDQQITYRALNCRANKIARLLMGCGVGPGALVGICLDRSVDLIASMLGVLKAGAAYLPLNAAYPKERLGFILRDASAAILLTQERLAANLATGSERIVCLDSDAGLIARQGEQNPIRAIGPEHLAYVIYTSGSTGLPKGVLIPHGALVNHRAAVAAQFDLGAMDRVLQFAPSSFDVAAEEIFPSLLAGATVILHPDPALASIHEFLEFLAQEHLTVVNLPAPYWHEMVAELQRSHSSLPSAVRLIIAGSDRVLPERLATWQRLVDGRVRWMNAYGLTETTVTATVFEPVASRDYSPMASVPIGRPLRNTHVYVLDRHLSPAPVGVAGELYIGGAGISWGYLNHADLTAERLIPNPYAEGPGERLLRTGDAAYFLPDGNLAFIGRLDDQVKVRGFRVELKEIEAALYGHAGVEAAVVVVNQARPGETIIVAYLVPDQQVTPSAGELRNFLKERLPEYMVPSAFVMLEAFPLLPSGKLDRRALPAVEGVRPALEASFVAPGTDVERTIAAVWQEVLRLEKVSLHDNFFDLGGHSLLLIQVNSRLREALNRNISMVVMFQYPTISALARHLSLDHDQQPARPSDHQVKRSASETGGASRDIAIIGMAGRFPGAGHVEEFWENLRNGTESITFFSDQEMLSVGIPAELINQPDYVKAGATLKDIELFDAAFFGFNPREAELMDPQHRLLLEAACQALENAGYDPSSFDGRIGLFAGAGFSSYLVNNLLPNRELINSAGRYQIILGNDRDHLTTLISYKLNLKGPSITVQTACSTSLVAVHFACQSLLNGESDMAMAGGVSISVPQQTGYLFNPGGILSPDGHCRAFDAKAQGMIAGNGVGVVVLKRLADALAAGDHVRAILKGSAINNDGSLKVGYTAPSVDGQAGVISDALAVAGVEAATISYIEAHGTATPLGDPVEVAALNQAMTKEAWQARSCAIGSVKTNIGHLDAAAGVAGLIKTVLSLEHKQLPASLHYETANPVIKFEEGPLYVNGELREWDSPGPRRAGVSSFGIGGTNAHVIVEEAPYLDASPAADGPHLLMLSARSPAALAQATGNFVAHLRQHPEINPADAAFTLAVGRKRFSHRRVAICQSIDDAVGLLESLDPARVLTAVEEQADRPIVFMFPGQGAQHPNMGLGLYRRHPYFRSLVDDCCQMLKPHLGLDLREVLYPSDGQTRLAELQINQTCITQSALFVIEYSLARLLMKWGVRPAAMIGHSIGEYVAACVSGVFSLEDALWLVALRGKLIQRLTSGAMLSVGRGEGEMKALLNGRLSIAGINGPGLCTISGPVEAVQELERELTGLGVASKRLQTSHAFHSAMMEPVVETFVEEVQQVQLNRPEIPYLSNVTGRWVREADALDAGYWGRHLRQTVRFWEGAEELLKQEGRVYLEVGPGRALSSMLKAGAKTGIGLRAMTAMRAANEEVTDEEKIMRALGELWLSGAGVKWGAVYEGEARRKVILPTYPFERQRYWVEPRRQAHMAAETRVEMAFGAAIGSAGETVAPQHARPDLRNEFIAPSTEIEKAIAAIWQELLGVNRVGLHDNFFEMGGHSLLITQVVARLREVFPIELPVRETFERPTIAGLAELIEERLIEMIEELPEDEAERLS